MHAHTACATRLSGVSPRYTRNCATDLDSNPSSEFQAALLWHTCLPSWHLSYNKQRVYAWPCCPCRTPAGRTRLNPISQALHDMAQNLPQLSVGPRVPQAPEKAVGDLRAGGRLAVFRGMGAARAGVETHTHTHTRARTHTH